MIFIVIFNIWYLLHFCFLITDAYMSHKSYPSIARTVKTYFTTLLYFAIKNNKKKMVTTTIN